MAVLKHNTLSGAFGGSAGLKYDQMSICFRQLCAYDSLSPSLIPQLGQPLGILGLHPAKLLSPTVVGRLRHLDDALTALDER